MSKTKKFLVRAFQFLASILMVAVLFDALLGFCLYKWYSFFQVPSYEIIKVEVPRKAKVQDTIDLKEEKPVSVEKNQSSTSLSSAIKNACAGKKFGEWCIKDLMGIAWAETRLDCSRVGDNGKSFGCFQIHLGYHKEITPDQAKDVNFSVNWTLNRLVANGYPEFRSYAIRRHNGGINDKTLAYLNTVNEYAKQ